MVTIAVFSALAVQTWFRPDTVIAGGDITPPEGTAWIGRLFATWTWSSSNIGGPSLLQPQAPWAVVLGVVHFLGGSAGFAQRFWFTALFLGAILAALFLLTNLGLSPVASSVGALAYMFSPFVVSNVIPNAVYLAALGLLAGMPALILAAANKRIPVWVGGLLLGLCAPLVGYVYQNPPLVGLVLLATLIMPFLVWLLSGSSAAVRALRTLAVGIPFLAMISLYWLVPAQVQLSSVASATLAKLSSWEWTESRSSIRNGLWLNTIWGWKYPEYYPYAPGYEGLPLSILKFAPACFAFAALLVIRSAREGASRYKLRLALGAATVALLLVFLSTGTNFPGSAIFLPLYRLPFGWLLREPGRFLMAGALAYCVLVSLTVDAIPRTFSVVWGRGLRLATLNLRPVVPVFVVMLAIPGFPLITGAIVPDVRPGLPSGHVRVPDYWKSMAAYMNAIPDQRGVLMVPPDDFYQVPYRWGYYGNDGFILNMLSRPVLDPSPDGYTPSNAQLINATTLVTDSMLKHDWSEASRILDVLQTPFVLVRGDVDDSFPGRRLTSPRSISEALQLAPNFSLVHREGPLELYASNLATASGQMRRSTYAFVNSTSPDLRALSLLPSDTALISGPPTPGTDVVFQAPPVDQWAEQGGDLAWTQVEPAGWSYQLLRMDRQAVADAPTVVVPGIKSPLAASLVPEGSDKLLRVTLSGHDVLPDSAFNLGLWQPVGDCADYHGASARPYLSADVLQRIGRGSGNMLRLSASVDSACEYRSLSWQHGPLFVAMQIMNESGSAPRVCLWEVGPNRCASLPAIPDGPGWVSFHATVTPDPNTRSIVLYLYSDANAPGSRTVNDYANIRVVELPYVPSFAIVGRVQKLGAVGEELFVQPSSFSNLWQGPNNARHVLVDGLLNGWLIRGRANSSVNYVPADAIRLGEYLSIGAFTVGVLILAGASWRRWRWRRRGTGPSREMRNRS